MDRGERGGEKKVGPMQKVHLNGTTYCGPLLAAGGPTKGCCVPTAECKVISLLLSAAAAAVTRIKAARERGGQTGVAGSQQQMTKPLT